MTQFRDYFSTAPDDYKRYRPCYPDELFVYLASIAPATTQAWDCGCGNGQAAVALAQRFDQVIATDASAAQIAQAEPARNLEYRVCSAEQIGIADASLDLITVAQAIHWFDHPQFFSAVERSLKAGGILAVWGYQLLYTDTTLDPLIEQLHSEIVGPYWPRERALLDNGYTRIDFPFPRVTPPAFYMRARWPFSHLLGYLNTWSAVKQYQRALGHNPIEAMLTELLAAWGDPLEPKDIYWPLILYIGKKTV